MLMVLLLQLLMEVVMMVMWMWMVRSQQLAAIAQAAGQLLAPAAVGGNGVLVDGRKIADRVADEAVPGDRAVIRAAGVAHPPPVEGRIREVAVQLDGALDVLPCVLAVDTIGGQVLAVPLWSLQASAQQGLVHMLVLAPAK